MLSSGELRYLAKYFGIPIERGIERPQLELSILGSPSVRVLAQREDFLALPVPRLKDLLKVSGVRQAAGMLDKHDIVDMLFASGHCVEEHAAPLGPDTVAGAAAQGPAASVGAAAGELHAALEASLQEADSRALDVNAPLSSALLESRLIPDPVVLLEVDRTLIALRSALLDGPELAEIREALQSHGHEVEVASTGAKLFVRPEQYEAVVKAVDGLGLRPRHIVVSREFEAKVTGVIEGVKRTSVKRRRVAETAPLYSQEPEVVVEVKRTFIHLEIPSSLRSGLSAPSAATF